MRHDDWQERLRDILEAATLIAHHVAGLQREAFEADDTRRDAVLYRLAVIGEAVANVPRELAERYPHVEWAAAKAMRDVIIHRYSAVIPEVVWKTVTEDLPRMVSALRDILATTSDE